MPQRSEQSRAIAKRNAILQAAVDLLYRDGLTGVTHRNVAALAGVPVGSIGYYYSNRETLITTCLNAIAERRQAFVETLTSEANLKAVADMQGVELAETCVQVLAGGENASIQGLVTASVDSQRESQEIQQALREHWIGALDTLGAVLDRAGSTTVKPAEFARSVAGATVAAIIDGGESRIADVVETEIGK